MQTAGKRQTLHLLFQSEIAERLGSFLNCDRKVELDFSSFAWLCEFFFFFFMIAVRLWGVFGFCLAFGDSFLLMIGFVEGEI